MIEKQAYMFGGLREDIQLYSSVVVVAESLEEAEKEAREQLQDEEITLITIM